MFRIFTKIFNPSVPKDFLDMFCHLDFLWSFFDCLVIFFFAGKVGWCAMQFDGILRSFLGAGGFWQLFGAFSIIICAQLAGYAFFLSTFFLSTFSIGEISEPKKRPELAQRSQSAEISEPKKRPELAHFSQMFGVQAVYQRA